MFAKNLKKAQQLILSGELTKAELICNKILKKEPLQINALQLLGVIALNDKKFEKSIHFFSKILQIKSDHVTSCYNIAIAYGHSGKTEQAIKYLKKTIKLQPDMVCAHRDLCFALIKSGDIEQAVCSGKKVIKLAANDPSAHYNLAKALHEWRDFDASFKHHKRADELSPNTPAILFELAQIYQGRGEVDTAKKYFRRIVELQPKELEPRRQLMMLTKYTTPEHEDIQNIKALVNTSSLSNDNRTSIFFMLSQAYSDCELYDEAFDYALKGNKIQDQIHLFNPDEFSNYITALINFYTPDRINKLRKLGNRSNTPIFIVGTPRSGTTLIEQILCSHQSVFGAGELDWVVKCINALPSHLNSKDEYPLCIEGLSDKTSAELSSKYLRYIKSLASGESRITDKMPGNFLHLGFIHILFPNARIIHCQREPKDACISMFLKYFPGAISYSYDLYKLGAYYSQYLRLMNHWLSVFSKGTILELKYESMIKNQEAETRRLLTFLNLEWDEACLHFHKKKRRVFTASQLQVRKPLYSSSVGRWKKYKKHLQPLEDGFNYKLPKKIRNTK